MGRRRPQPGPLGLIADINNPPPSLAGPIIELGEEYLLVPGGVHAGQPLQLTDEQFEVMWAWYSVTPDGRRFVFNRKLMLRMSKGWAKALALDTPLPTPTGWTTMGAVQVGDLLIDENGAPTKVTAVTEVMKRHACYRVLFRDGTSIVADAGHMWPVLEFTGGRSRRRATVPTAELVNLKFDRPLTIGSTKATRGGVARWLTLPTPVLAGDGDSVLPMPAYLLGYWLGDGDSDQARITTHVDDLGSLSHQAARVGWPLQEPKATGPNAMRVRFGDRGVATAALDALDVRLNKHVPLRYLRAPASDRLELLRGLMDSDGTVSVDGQCSFTSTSAQLVSGFMELARSLGFYPRRSEFVARLHGRAIGPAWRVTFHGYADEFAPFHLPRHCARLKPRPARPFSTSRTIVAVDRVPSVPVRCVSVAGASSLYLAGEGMVPTHNSPLGAFDAFANLVGPVVPDGLDAKGRPVGREHPAPWYQIAATSLDQTDNLFMQLYSMLRESPAIDDLKLDVGLSRIRCWAKQGEGVVPVSSEGVTKEGQPITGAAKEETQLWTASNGGIRLSKFIDDNRTKSAGGFARVLELYNAFVPGTGSVAERNELKLANNRGSGILHVAREATVPENLKQMRDPGYVRKQLAHAYGSAAMDAGGWIDLDGMTQDIVEANDDEMPDKIRKFFNVPWGDLEDGHDAQRWAELVLPGARLRKGDVITLGFDGSNVGDATALYACRWPDWCVFKLKVWERPLDEDGKPVKGAWSVPRAEVKAEVRAACRLYRIPRGYFDDSGWQSEIDELNGELGQSVQRWPHRQDHRIGPACERWTTMIAERTLRHDGDDVLPRHASNVRKVPIHRVGVKWWRPARKIDSLPIDAVSAAVSAVAAMGDAVAHGEVRKPKPASASPDPTAGPVDTKAVFRPAERLKI